MECILFLIFFLTLINSIISQDNSTNSLCYLTGYPKQDVEINFNLFKFLAFPFFDKMLQIQSRFLLHFGSR
jgi:hypothetical protein